MSNFAVQLANDILSLQEENERLRYENFELREYRDKYNELLGQSVAHGQQMMGSWLKLLTSDVVEFKTPEPIPAGVYYSIDPDNFYNQKTCEGMGQEFLVKWWGRREEFPTKPLL